MQNKQFLLGETAHLLEKILRKPLTNGQGKYKKKCRLLASLLVSAIIMDFPVRLGDSEQV